MARRGGLDIAVKERDDVTLVALSGSVDTTSAEQLKRQLAPLCTKEGARVLLDCTDLSYLNSSCIGQFTDFHRKCVESGGVFAVCCLDSSVLEIMDLLGVRDMLSISDTREGGISLLGR